MGCESSRPKSQDRKDAQSSTQKTMHFDSVYSLGHEIGSGNFSIVRIGTHKQTGEKHAVKIVKRAQLPVEDEESILMEVQILKRLKGQPNIVQITDFFEEKDYYYLVFEFMKGGELFDRIVEKQFYNEKEARDVIRILLNVVAYCQERNIVHRDLKPENLLLVSKEDSSAIKVCDFGFAREVGDGLFTQCGTPGFVAPEILYGYKYSFPVDIWSTGVITYILLGGYPPFHDENKSVLFKKIKRGKFSFHREYWKNVSNEAKDLIRKMLTRDPEKRITAAEALNHPWVVADDRRLKSSDLSSTLLQLKLFNARRKFKSTIRTVILANQLSRRMSYSNSASPTYSGLKLRHSISAPSPPLRTQITDYCI